MKILADLKDANQEQAILLKYTQKITKEDIEADPAWRLLASEYADCIKGKFRWEIKATCSVINSMYKQRRIVFAITRESTRELLKSDKNWPRSIGLKQDNYRKLLAFLFKNNIIEQVEYTKASKKVMVCKLVHPEFLKVIALNIEQQTIEAINFAKNMSKKETPSKNDMLNKYKKAIKSI